MGSAADTMIKYNYKHFSWYFRINGSSIISYRALAPAVLSFFITWFLQENGEFTLSLKHPYLHNMLAVLTSFVLTYRSQLGYQRFWEARGALQQMSAKWTDAVAQVVVCFVIWAIFGVSTVPP